MTISVPAFARVAVVLTVFDALMTWVEVTIGVAREGNPLLAHLAALTGLGVMLALRTAFGVYWVAALTIAASRAPLPAFRTTARHGLVLVAVLLGALACYHSVGLGVMTYA